ncbi:MAG: glycosyltransferase family 2 protein [Candidatus Gracilibacteria bacterium]
MSEHIITILTPTYNRAEKFLPQTIESIQNQSEAGFRHEHIIIDNASTDETQRVVAQYMEKDPRIKYIKNSGNMGPLAQVST